MNSLRQGAKDTCLIYVIGGGCFSDGALPPDARMRVIAAMHLFRERRQAGRSCQIVLLGGTFKSRFNDAVQEFQYLRRVYAARCVLQEQDIRVLTEGHSTAHQVALIRQDLQEREGEATVIANDWQLHYVQALGRLFKLGVRYDSVEGILRRRSSRYSEIIRAFGSLPCVITSKRRAGVQSQFVGRLGYLGYTLLLLIWRLCGTYMPPRPRKLFCQPWRRDQMVLSR